MKYAGHGRFGLVRCNIPTRPLTGNPCARPTGC